MKQGDILEVKRRHETSLLALHGIVGVGIGETEYKGRNVPCLRVYIEQVDEELEKQVPEILDGFPVAMVQVGKPILY